jgi:hypothetical protein
VVLTGWIVVGRSESRTEQGTNVFDVKVTSARLRGASQLGVINVTERADAQQRYVSTGEVRALQPGADFPATSYIDFYADVSAPESPVGALTLHNEGPLHLVPWSDEAETIIASWPPLGTTYKLAPLFEFDNDGDGLVDEDTADEDGDTYVDEDRAGPDPLTPGLPQQCGNDSDCDGLDGEDPPAPGCGALCDDDGDGAIDEDPSCVPLFNEGNTSLPLGVCITDLQIGIAPGTPSFSVAAGGPSRHHPADILGLAPGAESQDEFAPYVRIPCASLGLTADGCNDGSDGTQDDLDALSFGMDDLTGASGPLGFSVGPDALGLAGTAVETQRNCPPASPGLAPEPDGDIFSSAGTGDNALLFDGNGPVGACTPGFPLGLVEAATVRDDLDALDGQDASVVDTNGDGVPEGRIFFSLAEGSPSLAAFGFSPGDVLVTTGGAAPALYVSSDQVGLNSGEDLDALCVQEDEDPIYSAADLVYYSVAPRPQGPASSEAGPADVLMPPGVAVRRASATGLQGADDLDALECHMLGAPTKPVGDVTCDGVVNPVDALYVLQLEARLLSTLPCPHGDVNGDGQISSLDASLILQYAAGLLGPAR